MGHLLYLIFRCDFDVMESLENLEKLGTKHSPGTKHCLVQSQSGLSSLNLDGFSDGLRFRLSRHHFGCTITGPCLEELRNGDNEDTELAQDKRYTA